MQAPSGAAGELGLSPPQLQVMLGDITEFLAGELAHPTTTEPSWSQTEWIVAKAVVAMHGVAPLLSQRLLWNGPANWHCFLNEQREHTAMRHRRILEVVDQLNAGLRREGIATVGLKGLALHSIGVYEAGERPMADVDILVRPQDAKRAARVFESMDFQETFRCWKESEFSPVKRISAVKTTAPSVTSQLGEHADNDVKFELHERISEMLPWRITDISDRIFPSSHQPGIALYPSLAALLIHVTFHAAGAMAWRSVRLLHLHDISALCSRMTEADWNEFLASRSRSGGLWWAWPPLRLMSRYFGPRIPSRVVKAIEKECACSLELFTRRKSLSDVSYSSPWVTAFPGIAWACSADEALLYLKGRLRPTDEHQALQKQTAVSQKWASSNQWMAQSRVVRMMRWVTSRQMRPPTEHCLRAAIGRQQ